MLQLLSARLPDGVRLFQLPLPAIPTAGLTATPAPLGRDVRFAVFRSSNMSELVPAFTPAVCFVRVSHAKGGTSDCVTVWPEPVSIFGSFDFDGACWQFTYVGHVTQPGPQTAMMLAVSETPSRLFPRPKAEFFCLGSFRPDRYQSSRCR